MINLTKVSVTNVAVTRNETDGPMVQKDYILKDVWVNPEYIFLLEEDPTLDNAHKISPLKKGLDSRVGFTRVHIADKGHARQISVVGHPNMVLNKIREENE
mgnify:CR=1 FL=1|tara:strand:- start:64 stop:366 length:303 start_codon:yes stop_codon:yes gene_type:complete